MDLTYCEKNIFRFVLVGYLLGISIQCRDVHAQVSPWRHICPLRMLGIVSRRLDVMLCCDSHILM